MNEYNAISTDKTKKPEPPAKPLVASRSFQGLAVSTLIPQVAEIAKALVPGVYHPVIDSAVPFIITLGACYGLWGIADRKQPIKGILSSK